MSDYSVEITYKVWDNKNGVGIAVGPDPDGASLIHIYPDGKHSQEWFGEFTLPLSAHQARLLAGALLRAAEDLDHEQDQERQP